MVLVHGPGRVVLAADEVALVALVKDAAYFLGPFLAHHQRLGARRISGRSSAAIRLAHHCAHPGTHRPDAGSLGVDTRHHRTNGDLRPVPGFPGHRGDLNATVGDLRDLQREDLAHQVGVGTGQRDLRSAHAAHYRYDVTTQPLTVHIGLTR